MSSNLKKSQAHYDANADRYAGFVHSECPDFKEVHKSVLRHLEGHGVDLEGRVVLDYGAGEGRDIAYFMEDLDCLGLAIEPSDGLRAIAEERCPGAYWSKTATIPTYMYNKVDILWSSAVMQHMGTDELREFWTVARKAMKPGGWMVVTRRLTPYPTDWNEDNPRPFVDHVGHHMRDVMRHHHMEGLFAGFSERTLSIASSEGRPDVKFVTHIIRCEPLAK